MHALFCLRQIQTLAHLYQVAARSLPFDQWLNELAAGLTRTFHLNWLLLGLVDDTKGLHSLHVWERGLRSHTPVSSHVQALCDQVMSTAQSILVAVDTFIPVDQESGQLDDNLDKGQITAMAVPIVQGTQVHGVLGADHLFPASVLPGYDMFVLEHIATLVLHALTLHRRVHDLQQTTDRLLREQKPHIWPLSLVGPSRHISDVRQQVQQAGPTRIPILLQGQPGTQKNDIARTLHSLSSRRQGPFIRVNCTLPSPVLELELFGSPPTALAEGQAGRQGGFEAAAGGSLYLDHIDFMSSRLQNRVLRALQDNAVQRCGDHYSRPVDIRLIASCSQLLSRQRDRGVFRSELYYRITRFPIHIPTLRERPQDIEPILMHAFNRTQADLPHLTPAALHCLRDHSWPENVRELETLAAKLQLTYAGHKIQREHIQALLQPGPHRKEAADDLPPLTLPELEARAIVSALRRHQGTQHLAAQELGLSQRQLGYRIHKLGLRDWIHNLRRQSA